MENYNYTDAELSRAKVRVYGKAQNRTVLGIMHAYMLIHPETTLSEIRRKFPNDLNPDKGVPEIFIPAEENTDSNWNGYFKEEEALLTMGDGQKVAVVSMWTKPSFERAIEQAKKYDIVVASFDKSEGPGKKGGFRLEYLNGFTPVNNKVEEEEPKKKSKWWLWLIPLLILLGILAAWLASGDKEPEVKVVEKVVTRTDTVTVRDTVFIEQLAEIEKNFNAIQYKQGKADLSEDAKFVLHDLVKLLEKNADLRVKIVGHTSAEGEVDFNQKLSEARAKGAVDFVISRGIAEGRLEYEGKGSAELKNKENPMDSINRRTEFIVLD